MCLVFTRMSGTSYCRRLKSLLLYLYYVFRSLINSIVCCYFFYLYGGKRQVTDRRDQAKVSFISGIAGPNHLLGYSLVRVVHDVLFT